MAAGKLKIIRVLTNPRKRKKKAAAKRKAPMRRGAPLRAKAEGRGNFVLRVVTADRRAMWWNGKKWCEHRAKARHYKNGAAVKSAARTAKKSAGAGWVVMDSLPA